MKYIQIIEIRFLRNHFVYIYYGSCWDFSALSAAGIFGSDEIRTQRVPSARLDVTCF